MIKTTVCRKVNLLRIVIFNYIFKHTFCDIIPDLKKTHEIFREELLPYRGGKVPENAFIPERLSLNRLQQHGFFNSEGFLWDHIEPNPNRDDYQYQTQTIKAKINANYPQTVDTTYVLQKPVTIDIIPNLQQRCLPIIPITSLKLMNFYQSFNQNMVDDARMKSFPELPKKIFDKISRYL